MCAQEAGKEKQRQRGQKQPKSGMAARVTLKRPRPETAPILAFQAKKIPTDKGWDFGFWWRMVDRRTGSSVSRFGAVQTSANSWELAGRQLSGISGGLPIGVSALGARILNRFCQGRVFPSHGLAPILLKSWRYFGGWRIALVDTDDALAALQAFLDLPVDPFA